MMDKKRSTMIITAIFIATVILGLGILIKRLLIKPPVETRGSSSQVPIDQETRFSFKQVPSEGPSDKTAKEDDLEKLAWGRDPFTLKEIAQGRLDTVANLRLMGITEGHGKKPTAIINNRMVTIGSKIDKFKIVDIYSNSVIVSDDEKNYELRIRK